MESRRKRSDGTAGGIKGIWNFLRREHGWAISDPMKYRSSLIADVIIEYVGIVNRVGSEMREIISLLIPLDPEIENLAVKMIP